MTSKDSAHLKFATTTLLMGAAAAAADSNAGAALGGSGAGGSGSSSSVGAVGGARMALNPAVDMANAAVLLKQKLKDAAAAASASASNRSATSSMSSTASSLSSSAGIVNAISSALQNIITPDTDTDTEFYPQPVTTDLSESEEESVSEVSEPTSAYKPLRRLVSKTY